jgi:hypothetical protein
MFTTFKQLLRTGLALAGTLVVMLPSAQAIPTTYELSFSTTGQSIWDTGTANILEKNEFLGVAWQDQGVNIDAIAGDETTNVPNPLRLAYDAAFATCRLAFSASVCINGQAARLPVAALGSRPSIRSCGTFDVGCQIARAADFTRHTAYDVAFAGCTVGFSATVCRNGQSALVPVPPLGTAPAQFLSVDTRTGFALNGTTDGRVGLDVGLRMDSGSVDATVDFLASFDVPDTTGLDKANAISLNPNSVLAGTSTLNTTAPTVQLSVDAVMQISGSVTAEGCFIPAGCEIGSSPINLNERASVLAFNADGEGGVEVLGLPPSAFGAPPAADGFPLSVDAAGLAEVTFYLPQPNASGGLDASGEKLAATGQDDLVDLILDVDNIVAAAAGVPGLFGTSFDIPVLGSVGYDIINVSMGPTIDIIQDFELDPTLFVTLVFDQLVSIGGQIVDTFTSAWDLLPDITFLSDRTTVTPTFFVAATMLSQTLLDFDLNFGIDLLQIFYDFGALGSETVGVGNVLNKGVDLFQSPNLYEKLFALQGFNVSRGDSFVVDFINGSSGPLSALGVSDIDPIVLAGVSNTTDIPEPGSLLLVILALGAIVGSRRYFTVRRCRVDSAFP